MTLVPVRKLLDQYQWQFSNTEELQFFWKAVEEGNTEGIEKYLNRVLSNSVSVFDTKARNEEKEVRIIICWLEYLPEMRIG